MKHTQKEKTQQPDDQINMTGKTVNEAFSEATNREEVEISPSAEEACSCSDERQQEGNETSQKSEVEVQEKIGRIKS
jgi:hypothetical protein